MFPLLLSKFLSGQAGKDPSKCELGVDVTPPVTTAMTLLANLASMAPRYTDEEKGKHHMKEEPSNKIKRIKAPSLNNVALIRDYTLALIGRITNP